MSIERDIPGVKHEEKREDEDPNFFPIENGGILADLIRLQYPTNWSTPRRAAGPIVIDDKVMIFHAYDRTEGRSYGPVWAIDAAIPYDTFPPLILTEQNKDEDEQRIWEKFPEAQKLTCDAENSPRLSEYSHTIETAIARAVQLHKENRTEDS